jgi:hypothetical protein
MPKKKEKKSKWNKKKAENNTFLIEQVFSDKVRERDGCLWHDRDEKCNECITVVPDKTRHHAIWGNRENKVSLKTRYLAEYVPFKEHLLTPEKLDTILEKWGIYRVGRGWGGNLPEKFVSDEYLVFSAKVNPTRPRIYNIEYSGGRYGRPRDISYNLRVGERGIGTAGDVPLSLIEEFKRMVCLMMNHTYSEDFKLWHITMPLLHNFVQYEGIRAPGSVKKDIGAVYRCKTLTEAAEFVFGRATKAHRASILAWAKWKDKGSLRAAMAAKGLVPDDYLDALNIGQIFKTFNPVDEEGAKDVRDFRMLLKMVTETSRKKLMTDQGHTGMSITRCMLDLMRSVKGMTDAGEDPRDYLRGRMPSSWTEYHDIMSERYNRIQRDKEAAKFKAMKMAQDVGAKALHNVEMTVPEDEAADNETHLKIVIPEEGTQVVQWGTELNHCIGSYAKDMARGVCLLFGVYALNDGAEKLIATGEIRGGSLTQLYGPRNTLMKPGSLGTVCQAVARILPGLNVSRFYGTDPYYGPVQIAQEAPSEPALALAEAGAVALDAYVAPINEVDAPAPAGLPPADHHVFVPADDIDPADVPF